MKVYSHSKLSTFEQCKLKYKFRYIDKIIPEVEKTIEAHLGDIIHQTLEWLYSEAKESRIPSIDDFIVFYSKVWMENYKPDFIENSGKDEKFYFNKGIQYLLDYYNRYKPFDKENTLEVEKEIFIDLDEKGEIKIRGFIDRLAYNLQTKEYEIHDYKTSNTMPEIDKIENDRQLALYSIAVRELFPNAQVKLIWHYLFFNRRIESRRTHEQLEQLKKETLELINTIESTLNFPPHKSRLCEWCPYKPMCPAWVKDEYFPKWEKQKTIGEF